MPGGHRALAVEGDELLGDQVRRGAGLGARALPLRAAHARQRRRVAAGVRGERVDLLGRPVAAPVAELQDEVVAHDPVDRPRRRAREARDAVLAVHDVAAHREVVEEAVDAARAGARGAVHRAPPGQVGLAPDDDVGVVEGEAGRQRRLDHAQRARRAPPRGRVVTSRPSARSWSASAHGGRLVGGQHDAAPARRPAPHVGGEPGGVALDDRRGGDAQAPGLGAGLDRDDVAPAEHRRPRERAAAAPRGRRPRSRRRRRRARAPRRAGRRAGGARAPGSTTTTTRRRAASRRVSDGAPTSVIQPSMPSKSSPSASRSKAARPHGAESARARAPARAAPSGTHSRAGATTTDVQVGARALVGDVERAQPLDLVAEQVDAHRPSAGAGHTSTMPAAHRELAAVLDQVLAAVAGARQPGDQVVAVARVAGGHDQGRHGVAGGQPLGQRAHRRHDDARALACRQAVAQQGARRHRRRVRAHALEGVRVPAREERDLVARAEQRAEPRRAGSRRRSRSR